MDCPPDLRKRAAILYQNGFMGFQEPAERGCDKDRFVVLWTGKDLSEPELEKIKSESNSNTLVTGYWIGREYLSIHWTEYNKITDVINAFLKLGYSFQVQTKGMPSFDSPEDKEFTFELLEKKVMKQASQLVEYKLFNIVDHAYCEEWNYITKEGKEFANSLKNGIMSYRYDNERTNFYHWEEFKNYDKTTLLSLATEVKEEVNDKEACMVCLDNEPNTMVLPCEHCVVCKECSLKLENTNNSMKCVKCRQDITFKLY